MKPTKVGPKFQVVIPVQVREQVGLEPGDLVVAEVAPDGAIILRKKILADPSALPIPAGNEPCFREPVGERRSRRRSDRSSVDSALSAGGEESKMLHPDQISAILKRYSDGKSSPEETLKKLGLDYGTLLTMLSRSNLPWPRLPKAERERMAKEFVELWSGAEPE
jgi:AbrB family looped-hinge helix DNA binding protein